MSPVFVSLHPSTLFALIRIPKRVNIYIVVRHQGNKWQGRNGNLFYCDDVVCAEWMDCIGFRVYYDDGNTGSDMNSQEVKKNRLPARTIRTFISLETYLGKSLV